MTNILIFFAALGGVILLGFAVCIFNLSKQNTILASKNAELTQENKRLQSVVQYQSNMLGYVADEIYDILLKYGNPSLMGEINRDQSRLS